MTAATQFEGGKYTNKYRHGPAKCNDDPATVLAIGFVKYYIGHHPGSEQEEDGGTDKFSEKRGHKQSFLMRKIMGGNIFKVIDTKLIKEKKSDAKKWYVIDGSFMNDLCDTWAIGQKWSLAPISNKRDDKLIDVWLAGSTCDSDDVYRGINNYVTLPEYDYSESSTDPMYIVVFDTGAYQDALSMNHCLVAHPQRIIAENGHIVLARKRSTPEEVGRNLGWNGGFK